MSGAGTVRRLRHGLAESGEQLLRVEQCINGYFTQGIIPSGRSPGGAYLGAAVIRISG